MTSRKKTARFAKALGLAAIGVSVSAAAGAPHSGITGSGSPRGITGSGAPQGITGSGAPQGITGSGAPKGAPAPTSPKGITGSG